MERRGQTENRSLWGKASLLRLIAGASMIVALMLPAMSAGAAVVNGDGWEFQTAACNGSIGIATGKYEIGPGVAADGLGVIRNGTSSRSGIPTAAKRGL